MAHILCYAVGVADVFTIKELPQDRPWGKFVYERLDEPYYIGHHTRAPGDNYEGEIAITSYCGQGGKKGPITCVRTKSTDPNFTGWYYGFVGGLKLKFEPHVPFLAPRQESKMTLLE